MLTQIFINGLIAGSIFSLVAISFVVIYIPSRFFHFTHGAVLSWGAYCGYALHVLLNLPLFLTVPLVLLASGIMGAALEIFVYRPLRERGATSLVLLLASLGVYIVLQNVLSLLFGDSPKSLNSGRISEGLNIMGGRITTTQIFICFTSAILFLLTSTFLYFSQFGKALRAIASDIELAAVHGINIRKIIIKAFAIGSAMVGITALLIALDTDMTPTMGLNLLMMGVVAMIIGGVGSIRGAMLGGFLLGFALHIGAQMLGSQWQDAIAFCLLILFLTVRRYGILGKPTKWMFEG